MHEYSLASAIVEQVKKIREEHHAQAVKKIIVSAGPYELIIPDLLQDAYEIITNELEEFKDSTLELVTKPASITCLECEYQGEPDQMGDDEFAFNFKCPKCGSRDTHLNMQYLTIESVDLVFN
ncbi:MAG: hydrogenase maturation nickel metallochaperone HypA/HybF [Candidatus Heimdallarchaeaceae archaeon]